LHPRLRHPTSAGCFAVANPGLRAPLGDSFGGVGCHDAQVTGETDLGAMLASLDVVREPGVFVVATILAGAEVPAGARAQVREREGLTVVLLREDAVAAGLEFTFESAWLTLTVHSSFEAVGLTAAFAARLAEDGIPANVLAGYHHDHLLVPAARADDAIAALRSLRGG
jgi:uncharacterized protein